MALVLLALCMGNVGTAVAQRLNAMAYYVDSEGDDQSATSIGDGEAPLDVTFRANPEDIDGLSPTFEWHFRHMDTTGSGEYQELFVRYEEDTQYTFTESGTFNVLLRMLGSDGQVLDSALIVVSIAESSLKFPNAFSPNGDGINDTYKATEYKSIVSFRAIILSRWGQKLYEWKDPAGEWDGTHNGHPVKDGVYYVQVIAKGADGRNYHIRKDVNLLRGFSQGTNEGGGSITP